MIILLFLHNISAVFWRKTFTLQLWRHFGENMCLLWSLQNFSAGVRKRTDKIQCRKKHINKLRLFLYRKPDSFR